MSSITSLLDMDARPYLHEYLARIGLSAADVAAPSLAALRLLHEHHVTSIPFESFDIVLKGEVRIDLPSIVEKLVRRKRGGYCFENNKLFAAVLLTLGYKVEHKRARVFLDNGERPAGAPPYVPLENHMVNVVAVPGEAGRYLCDVGFGDSHALRRPLLMETDREESQYSSRYKYTVNERGIGALWQQFEGQADWLRMYGFNVSEDVFITDYYMENLYTYLCPDSLFVCTRWICRYRPSGSGFTVLEENRLKVRDAVGKATVTDITSAEALRTVLKEHFDVTLSLEEATLIFRANAQQPIVPAKLHPDTSTSFANPACVGALVLGVAIGVLAARGLSKGMGEKGVIVSLLDMDARPYLHEYLARIGLSAADVAAPSLAALRLLHEHHLMAIPFEPFDVVLKGEVRIDLPSIVEKLVRRKRGGYCYETNKLLAAVLLTLGYKVEHKRARVFRDNGVRPAAAPPNVPLETHMVNVVTVPGEAGRYLCDVGFGNSRAPYYPVQIAAGEVQAQYSSRFKYTENERGVGALWQQFEGEEEWMRLYGFNPDEEVFITDFYMANLHTFTCPDSRFLSTRWIARLEPGGGGFTVMEENQLRVRDAVGNATVTDITSAEALRTALKEHFDVTLSLAEATLIFRANAQQPIVPAKQRSAAESKASSKGSPLTDPVCIGALALGFAIGVLVSRGFSGTS